MIAPKACRHCGKDIDAYHRRIWPTSNTHVTCASGSVVDGVCAHSSCCCKAHAATDSRTWAGAA